MAIETNKVQQQAPKDYHPETINRVEPKQLPLQVQQPIMNKAPAKVGKSDKVDINSQKERAQKDIVEKKRLLSNHLPFI